MPTEEYKQEYKQLNDSEKALCLALFAIDNKLDACNPEYIKQVFDKTEDVGKYIFQAQQVFTLEFKFYSRILRHEI